MMQPLGQKPKHGIRQLAVMHLQAENREELRVAQNQHAHYAECAQAQSHRIREHEQRVSDDLNFELNHAEARISNARNGNEA